MAKNKAFKNAKTKKSKKGLIYVVSLFWTALIFAVVIGSMTVAAQIREYNVTFNYHNSYTAPVKVKRNEKLDLEALEIKVPVRSGYTFLNWKMYGKGKEIGIYTGPTKVTSNIYMHSQWAPNVYEVTLNAQGGNSVLTKINVTFAKKFNINNIPTKANYTFGGWFDAGLGKGNMYVNAKGVGVLEYNKTYNATLYAYWIAA